MSINEKEIKKILSQINYPGLNKDIVSFGFIKDINCENQEVTVDFAPTTKNQDVVGELKDRIKQELKKHPQIKSVVVVDSKKDAAAQQKKSAGTLPEKKAVEGVKNVIAVASGKGGVGKSTVAANLAAAFQSEGLRSGLLDLDIYGPSIPTMFGLNERPEIGGKNADKIMPLDYRGLQVMSLGLVINPEEPVIWRGPMVSKAVKQLLRDVVWDDLDCLVIDLPPGTGDTQLSLLQLIPVAGAIIVTTPQEVALSDVRKGTQMFRKMGTSVLGIIENMAGFICPKCGHKSEIFGSGGGEREAKRLGVEMLGRIPLKENLRSSGDEGTPLVFSEPESNGAKKFKKISRLVTEKLQAADTD